MRSPSNPWLTWESHGPDLGGVTLLYSSGCTCMYTESVCMHCRVHPSQTGQPSLSIMPKNKGKGGKNRRRGKNENEEKRELVFKEHGQEYAQVLRMLGNGRLEAQCVDGVKRLCHIRGKMRKKVWVNTGDIILLGLREYQDEKADVIQKFMADEARSLKAYGELPESIRVNETDTFGEENGENDEYFDFDDVNEI